MTCKYYLRVAAWAVAVTAGTYATALPRQDDALKKAVKHERWSIKTSAPAGADLSLSKTVALSDLIDIHKLTNPPGAKPKDKAFDDKRYPAFPNTLGIKEGDLITTSGWLHLVAHETDDGDFHVQISTSKTDGNNCMIVEVPDPEGESVTSPDLQSRFAHTRAFLQSKIKGGGNPSGSGSLVTPAVYVRVTGVLFFDGSHVKKDGGMQDRGKQHMKAATLWELHPITLVSDDTPPN